MSILYKYFYMNNYKYSIILLTFLLAISTNINAQSSDSTKTESQTFIDSCDTDYNKWYVSGIIGVHQFYGDISENTFFTGGTEYGYFNGMWGVKVGRSINSKFGFELAYSMGKMSSSRKDIWFKSSVRNIGMNMTIGLSNIIKPLKFDKKWNIDLIVGAGIMGHRSLLLNGANNDSIIAFVGYDKDGNTDGLKYLSYFNFGANIAYKINDRFDVFLELNLTNTPTDNLDAKPVTLSELDKYSYTAIGIRYTIGKHKKSYKWNPKPCYYNYLENGIDNLKDNCVDMGNSIDTLEQCCSKKNYIDPCDTSTVDTDGDAIPDCRDLEENSPKNAIVNFQGIALVVKDSVNNTPSNNNNNPGGIMNGNGGAANIFFDPIYFEYNKSSIQESPNMTIVNLALFMKKFPNSRIQISGNCDSKASNEYNFNLSERRCNSIMNILIKEFDINRNRFSIKPNGKKHLLFKQNDYNRRVDFTLIQ